jgi:hypothetical protein
MRHDQGTGADPGRSAPRVPELTTALRSLIGVVAGGAVIIAGIGFVGSYRAVQRLAWQQGFGYFSYVFPVGIDAGIVVLLSLDLVLTYLRMPLALLRYMAWLLTAATVAFNAAASWPDPLPMTMHGVIPLLFVAITEAARHAIARVADLKADKRMEGIRLIRWLVAPWPTFTMWRRMAKWEIRSYERAVEMERRGLVYRELLAHEYGPGWEKEAPAVERLPLKLARFGELLPSLELPETELLRKYSPQAKAAPELERGAGTGPAELEPPAPAAEPPAVETGSEAPAEPVAGTWVEQPVEPAPVPFPAPRTAWNPAPGAFQPASEPQQPAAATEGVDWAAWEAEQAPRPVNGHTVYEEPVALHGGLGALGEPEQTALDQQLQAVAGEESQEEGSQTAALHAAWEVYQSLTQEERQLPATKLADLIAPKIGATAGTTRKYIGRIRRELAEQ